MLGLSIAPELLGVPSGVLFVCLFVCFLLFRAAPAAYEVPRLEAESELQLLVYTTATAMLDT